SGNRTSLPMLPTAFEYSAPLMEPNLSESSEIYSGPVGIEGWQQEPANPSPWSCINGALYSNAVGSIGRDVRLPDVARIEFDWSWKTNNPQLQLSIYTDQLTLQHGNSYLLYL